MRQTSANLALVEDDASVRKAILRLLSVAGFSASGFASAEAFLESGSIKQVDCLIIDINLPGLSGFELQEKLTTTASLPVIFITAHDEPCVRAKYHQSGGVAYLVKPFPSEELLTAIRTALCVVPQTVGSHSGRAEERPNGR